MKDVVVCSYATEVSGLMHEYANQLNAAEIDFYVKPVDLPYGINTVTARWKFEFMWNMTQKFMEYQKIIFTDAWDVLFFGEKKTIPTPNWIVFSAERNCWPEPELSGRIKGKSPWRFVNAGLCIAEPEVLFKWLRQILRHNDLDIMEQAWLNRWRAIKCDFFLDSGTAFFYTVSDKEDGSLRLKDGRVWNSTYDTYPQFFHFSGKCPTDRFRAMLRGDIESL